MRRHLRAGAVAAALLGMACPLPAGEKLYQLRKVPKFRVGDRAVAKKIDSREVSSIASGGKIVQGIRGRKEFHYIHEVLEVDKAGKVQAFRVTIVSAKDHIVLELEGAEPGKKDVAIEKIHFVARRKGLYFFGDTTTVVSEKAARLEAPQIWLLKEFCREGISFAAYSEGDALLLSAMPVLIGHSWKPSRQVLDEWVKANPTAKAVGGKALSAELKLVSVKDDIALVKGEVLLEANLPGLKLKIQAVFTGEIDTGSGRWTGASSSGSLSHKTQGGTFKRRGRGEQTNTFTAGKGKASALPAQLYDLGWKPPGKDTNNHKDPAKGFSLNVPAGYAAQQVKPGGKLLAAFVSKRGVKIRVDDASSPLPLDVEEFVGALQAAVCRTMPDYRIVERKSLVLPGNVPAVLLVGTAYDGKVTTLTVVAFDGPRGLSVTGGAPTASKRELAEIRKAVQTLRVFAPDMAEAP